MKVDNTPTVSKRSRTPSRKLRLRLDTAKRLKTLNQRSKTVRQKKKEMKINAKVTDPEKHVSISRVPRVKKNKLADPPKATTKYKKTSGQQDVATYASVAYQASTYDQAYGAVMENGRSIESNREELQTDSSIIECEGMCGLGSELYVYCWVSRDRPYT